MAFAPGLALRMATSVKAMGFLASPGFAPQIYPQARGYRIGRLHIPPNHTPKDWWLNANRAERLRPDNR